VDLVVLAGVNNERVGAGLQVPVEEGAVVARLRGAVAPARALKPDADALLRQAARRADDVPLDSATAVGIDGREAMRADALGACGDGRQQAAQERGGEWGES
jgi:hypothetical protein